MNRICRTCKEEKALQENYYKSKKSPGGYHTKCKACCKAYHQEYHKQTYKPNPRKLKYPYLESSYSKEYARNNHLLIKYGITIEEYRKRLDDQDYKCKICEQPLGERLCVDHCHTSGKVRGLLCHKCNQGLSLFKDSVQALKNAITYLENGLTAKIE
ncbi:MAG: hypothetical protein E6R13_08355 [Spirochaetes bacterium]|nr:MAG: hypothetical protein E6R13_08355 [Spirochaetota bacterium]